jgi:4-hydroxythreonine-4-phosphate dehydrogenase
MGCPASIGPEIILKYFSDSTFHPDVSAVVLGDITVLEKCARDLGRKDIKIEPWTVGQDIPLSNNNTVPVLALSSLAKTDIVWGQPNAATGKAMAGYITEAVKLAQKGVLDGLTTCPISKYALNQAGFSYPGHTEMLAALTKTKNYAMMMAGDRLRVTLVTIHCPLADVAGALTRQSILQLIKTTHQALTVDFGISRPQIAVAALNPHAGENLLFGREEQDIIGPAIAEASEIGLDIFGPFPPDTVFYKAAQGSYDAVVCMYHDQGLIPFKLLHFDDGVNVTLGLPIVRTSVDHGTAYDIAGRGIASSSSLSAAVSLAGAIAKNRKAKAATRGRADE